MKLRWYNILLLIVVVFVTSCANIVTPTGGAKDILPPEVVSTSPKNKQINFKEKHIEISFNEFFKLNDSYNQVLVSPYLKSAPDLKIRGKSLIIKFSDTLHENTTYTISFGNSIGDITENNLLKGYDFSFSTGSSIDSMLLEGKVVNAFTHKPEPGIYVLLYTDFFDSVPYVKKPLYLSKTDDFGAFHLKNLKNQPYKIFALKDADADLLFGLPNEEIAFLDSLTYPKNINPVKSDSSADVSSIQLHLFKEQPSSQKLLKAGSAGLGKVQMTFRLPVKNLEYKALKQDEQLGTIIQEYSKKRDTVIFWIPDIDRDSLIIELSDAGKIIDTVYLALIKKAGEKSRGKGEEAAKIVKLITNITSSSLDYFKALNIQTSAPIKNNDFSKIILTEDKDTIKPLCSFSDSIHRNLTLNNKWKEDTPYRIIALPGAFTDIFGNPNDTLKQSFRTTKSENYCKVNVRFSTGISNAMYLVQLLTDKDVQVDEQVTEMSADIEFINVLPGSYKLRVIRDTNKNGEWDTGNYLNKHQPEKIFYYPATLTVRANWDQQIEWNIDPK